MRRDAFVACLFWLGRHNPENERSEIYNRIEGYFQKSAGGTIIIKNVHLLTFEKQSVLLHILETEHPDVFQLAHVAGPRIEFQCLDCRCVEVLSRLACLGRITFEEEIGNFRNVLCRIFQRRHSDA